jgi:hypothetical protein
MSASGTSLAAALNQSAAPTISTLKNVTDFAHSFASELTGTSSA